MPFFLRNLKGRITALASPVPLPVNGMWFVGTNLQNVRHGWNEPATAQCIKNNLKPGSIFIDIGANYGFYSVLAAKAGARVISYEPDDTSLRRLRTNLWLNRARAEVREAAVSDHEGTIAFYITKKGSGLNSTRADVLKTVATKKEVPTEPCRDYYDLCKIDVEGAELSVLKGMQHKGLIICELNPTVQSRQGVDPKDVLNAIRSLGWSIEDIEEGPQSDDYIVAKAHRDSVLNLLLRPVTTS